MTHTDVKNREEDTKDGGSNGQRFPRGQVLDENSSITPIRMVEIPRDGLSSPSMFGDMFAPRKITRGQIQDKE